MSKDRIVAKFGGTSMADAAAITQSAKVAVLNDVGLVVVSAVRGTTDILIDLKNAVLAHKHADADTIIRKLIKNHQEIADDLGIDQGLQSKLQAIFDDLQSVADNSLAAGGHERQTSDHLLAFGELLSSVLMVTAFDKQGVPAELIDAREVIKTDNHFGRATPLIDKIGQNAAKLVIPKLGAGKVLVTQGYIGSSPEGATTTLGRGGSDYTAALLAEAVDAAKLQIWTDVAGIASTDPTMVKTARQIEQLTFQEAAELATAGAHVLYPRTITPLRRANIELYIGNTFAPEAGGTTISEESDHQPLVRAIALKTGQSIVRIKTQEMAQQFGYMARVFNVFAEFKVSIDQISTSEIAIAVVLDDQTLLDKALMKKLGELGEISVEKDLSVISLIGNGINNAPGLIQAVFGRLEDDDPIPVKMICQGASRHNLCFLVPDKYGHNTVRKLHEALIES